MAPAGATLGSKFRSPKVLGQGSTEPERFSFDLIACSLDEVRCVEAPCRPGAGVFNGWMVSGVLPGPSPSTATLAAAEDRCKAGLRAPLHRPCNANKVLCEEFVTIASAPAEAGRVPSLVRCRY